ncbi:MAG: hypothetical protein QW407_05205 [Thermofilaceae archaeon]
MRRVVLAVSVAVLAVAVALFFHFRGQVEGVSSAGQGSEGIISATGQEGINATGQAEVGVTYLLRLEVEGAGRLLVNGTPTSLVDSKRPFTALVEAVPDACYVLRQLLVNGTPVEGSRVSLEVKGNTTVVASFTRYCVLVRFEVVGAGSLLVNGSLVANGSVLEVAPGTALMLTLEAPEHIEAELYVNGSKLECPQCAACPGCPRPPFFIKVRGDTLVSAVFQPWIVTLHVETGGLPAILSSRGWQHYVNGSATIEVEAGSKVNVITFCEPYEGELLCIVGWYISYPTRLGLENATAPPNCTFVIRGDTRMKAVVSKVKGTPPQPAQGVVLLDGREVEATMYPNPFVVEVRPWSAEFRHLGNGTWLIDSPVEASLFLQLPSNWSLLTLEIWVDYVYASPYISATVVVSEQPNQTAKGCSSFGAPLKPYFRIVLTRSGEVLEMPEDWGKTRIGWVGWNPMAREGWLYLNVDGARVRIRVSLSG